MSFMARVRRELRFLSGLIRTLSRVRSIGPESPTLACDDLEAAVETWRTRRAITLGERTITYGEMDEIANRYAHWAIEHGLRRGQTVVLYTPTRIDYLSIWYGLSKVGVAVALINNSLTGQPLAHCLEIARAGVAIVDGETARPLLAANQSLDRPMSVWTLGPAEGAELRDLPQALRSCSQLKPDRAVRDGMTAKDLALFIYTSGTTGLPKAAKINHMRAQLYMRGFAGATNAKADDRIYVTLPLHHATGGLCATGAALLNGGSVVLRPHFSAGHFWSDIVREGCTMFVYIGELCRYLLNQPEQDGEQTHKVRMAFGNGLRPEIWKAAQRRFRLPHILEFYGSTEGNVSLFNLDGRAGAIGRIPSYLSRVFNVRLARFDIGSQSIVRGAGGLGVEAGVGEVGECVGQIDPSARAAFSGYADKAASEKKIERNLFRLGDAWFATGDLMRQDADGYFYFVDRVGDTFRWKGENVSTGEVEQALAAVPCVKEASVYGVKVGDLDGRAGMASLVVGDGFDMAALGPAVEAALPAYARPVFVRLEKAIATTGTFKHRKIDMVAEGFDPAKVKRPLYVHAEGAYEPLDAETANRIADGEMRV